MELAKFVDKIEELVNPPVVRVNGEEYVKQGYFRPTPPSEELDTLMNEQLIEQKKLKGEQDLQEIRLGFYDGTSFERLSSLSSLCDMLIAEIERNAATLPLFVSVTEYNTVEVFGSYEANFTRRKLYAAKADNKEFAFGEKDTESAIIALQTQFVDSDDLPYVLELCAKVTSKAEVTNEDNGLTQQVTVVKGVSMLGNVQVKPRVNLRPFRTFIEVKQPLSTYLLRFREGGMVSLTGADGGAWKLAAKANIASYLRERLKPLVDSNTVIVTQ